MLSTAESTSDFRR